jgi:hypothetical protein
MKMIVVATIVAIAGLAGEASRSAVQATGVLRGTTEISFGCPGPTTEPPCNPWRPFPLARFTVARAATPGRTTLVRSNANARFSVRLAAGTYLVTPLRQGNARGGPQVRVRIRGGLATTARVRFEGFPQME